MRFLLLALVMLTQTASPKIPQAEISNETVRATIYLPSAESGYYRGTRFDWSGVISSLKWRDHEYFGQWFEKYDPKIHDAIAGPVEEPKIAVNPLSVLAPGFLRNLFIFDAGDPTREAPPITQQRDDR